jgi:hypothetical protein
MKPSFQLMMHCLNCVGMPFMLAVCVSHLLLLNIFNNLLSLLVIAFFIGALCTDK